MVGTMAHGVVISRLPGSVEFLSAARRHPVCGGNLPKVAHRLVRFRIHVDADDPLSVLGNGGRREIPEPSFRRQAVLLMDAITRGHLTLNFWSDIQLRTFLANLRF